MVEDYVRFYGVAHPDYDDQFVAQLTEFTDEDIPQ